MKNRNFDNLLIMLILFFIPLLSGCSDGREIDSYANVAAVGIEPDDGGTKYTFAVADVSSFESDGDGGEKSNIICFEANNDSMENAVENVNSSASKSLSFSHMSVAFISKECKEKEILSLINYFEKLPDIRPQTLICISDMPPSEYLNKISPELEVNPEKYFMKIFRESDSYIPVLQLSDFTDSLSLKSDVIAPVIMGTSNEDKLSEQDVIASGFVVINGGKMSAVMTDTAPLGLLRSEKSVNIVYNGKNHIVKNTSKPKIKVKSLKPLEVSVDLRTESHGIKNADYVEGIIKNFLTDMSSKGYDVLNLKKLIRPAFSDIKGLNGYNLKNNIINIKSRINVFVADKE